MLRIAIVLWLMLSQSGFTQVQNVDYTNWKHKLGLGTTVSPILAAIPNSVSFKGAFTYIFEYEWSYSSKLSFRGGAAYNLYKFNNNAMPPLQNIVYVRSMDIYGGLNFIFPLKNRFKFLIPVEFSWREISNDTTRNYFFKRGTDWNNGLFLSTGLNLEYWMTDRFGLSLDFQICQGLIAAYEKYLDVNGEYNIARSEYSISNFLLNRSLGMKLKYILK